MRRILITGFLVVLLAAPAMAQDGGRIGVYTDDMATGCLIQDTPGGVYAYVVHTGATEANASQFAIAIDPSVHLTFLSGTVNPAMISLGDLFDGIVISYIGCKTGFPLKLATLTFLGDGSTTTCGAIRVVPDPDVPSGQVEVVDCSLNIQYATTANAWVNSTGDCDCIYSARMGVATSAPDLNVIVDGNTYTSPRWFYWDSGTSHTVSTTSPQGPTDMKYLFTGWSDGGAMTHTIDVGNQDSTLTAYFEPTPTTTITSIPPGLDVIVGGFHRTTPYEAHWIAGTSHLIRAVSPQGTDPDSMYSFVGWSDGGAIQHSIVAADHDTTFTALFGAFATTEIDTDPTGFDIVVDGIPRVAPYSALWAPGSVHSIEAVSPQGGDTVYVFGSWSDGGARAHNVVAGVEDSTFVASFVVASEVSFTTNPPGLEVQVDAVVHSTPYSEYWAPGADHQIAAVSPQGTDPVYFFSSWSDGGALSHTVSVGPNDTTFTATHVVGLTATIDTDPSGFDVVVDSVVYTTPQDMFWLQGSSHEIGTVSPQGIEPKYAFDSWSDAGAITHNVLVGVADTTFVATFVRLAHVTINTQPQGYEVSADSVAYGTPAEFHWLPGSSHTLSVPDSVEYQTFWLHFGGWNDVSERERVFVTPGVDTVLTAYYGAVTGVTQTPVPSDVVLRPNTPNPFNPTTHIEFSVPSPQFVELLIFDVSGRLVRRLYAEEASAGFTTVTWHGRSDRGDLAGSGVYFYQLRTREERVTRKMVLLK